MGFTQVKGFSAIPYNLTFNLLFVNCHSFGAGRTVRPAHTKGPAHASGRTRILDLKVAFNI